MKITMTAKNPSSHEYTMEATMTLKEWVEIRKELAGSSRSPIWEFTKKIDDAVQHAEDKYLAGSPDDG